MKDKWRPLRDLERLDIYSKALAILGTFCKTKIAIFVKARGRGAKKMAHVREYPHESSCGRPSSRTNFSFRDRTFVRWIQWFSWFSTVFGWFFPFNWICQHFFPIEIWTSVMFSWSTFGLWWVACRMAFWTWCSSRWPSIQFELAMDLILRLRLRVGRAMHQLSFVDVTVFMREQSEKGVVRKSSTITEQEITTKSWSQTVQTTRLGCQTDRSKLHTTPAALTSIFCLQNDATVRRTVTTFVCPQTQFHENLHTNFALQKLPYSHNCANVQHATREGACTTPPHPQPRWKGLKRMHVICQSNKSRFSSVLTYLFRGLGW